MMGVGDPVRSGFVASLARPGGNITGMSNLMPELAGKRLDLLKKSVQRYRGSHFSPIVPIRFIRSS